MRRNLVAVSAVLAMELVTGCASTPMAGTEPVLASEISEIVHSYDQYNAELKKLNLPEPMSGNLFGKKNTDSIKRYYTKAMSEEHDRCSWIPYCRMSDEIALEVQTMMNYRVISLEEKNGNLVRLKIIGTNTHGSERQVIVDWLFESGKWRIDEIVTAPPNW